MLHHAIVTLFAAAQVSALPMKAPAIGQTAAAGDSIVSTLLSRDSGSRLTLTSRTIAFEFTREGVERARERADSSLQARHSGYGDTWLASIVRTSVEGAMRGIHIAFKLDDIESATADGDTIVFTFKESARNRNSDNTFDFDAPDAATAARFAARVNAALRARR
jgi:hypothetical protein